MGKKAVFENIEAELLFLGRRLNRLEEGFQLEKEEALKDGLNEMTLFRERCRNHYQLRVGQVQTRVKQLLYSARRADALTPDLNDLAGFLGERCREALARYSGTPNRLVRAMKSTLEEKQ